MASRKTTGSNEEKTRHAIQNLRATFGVPRRERESDPLDVLIETILSQATSDTNSGRAFQKLKDRFPSWEGARRARVTSIEAAIRSGGLAKQKSARIKSLLNDIHDRLGSLDLSFLRTAPIRQAKEFLGSFKGVGPKTVACTLLFACKRPVFRVDTHIMRIARRLELIPRRCSDEEAHRIMGQLVPTSRYFEFHVNLIRLGRTTCRPQNPLCQQCCLIDYCGYYRDQSAAKA